MTTVCTKPSEETEYLTASMGHVPSSDLNIVMMDVEKQSNGSACGVLTIAYVFDVCSGMDPCTGLHTVRSENITCLENCQVSRVTVLGDRERVQRDPNIVELHCSCRMPERDDDLIAECDSSHIWHHHHCMDIPSEVSQERGQGGA